MILTKISRLLKPIAISLVLVMYITICWVGFTKATPTGASLTLISTDAGPTGSPASRSDAGGTINTITVDAVQQNPGWKAYVGNVSGRLVLRNANSQSIYEWTFAGSSLSGNVFISRSNSINWTPISCASLAQIDTEDTALGFNGGTSDSLNKTFNYTLHKAMTISDVGTISASTCRSTATYVNNTAQVVSATATFQEILLSDGSRLVYGTFIDQDASGFDTNATNAITHDFQAIVGDPKNVTDYTYYFYADIS